MSAFEGKKDYTSDLQALIPQSLALANENGLDEALTLLLSLEKKCRLSNDIATLKEVCLYMVRLCREKNDWLRLNSTLTIINKRNALNRGTISAIVSETITYIDSTPSVDTKIELIKTMQIICDGKIYVEGESAQLHFMLSKIYEDQGNIDAACEAIQDVHVETYGSLTRQQKAEYILDQMRLNLLKRDYIRALIHSRKMNTKTIDEAGFEAIKAKFYTMMIEYHSVDKNCWEICQAYYKIANISPTSSDAAMEVEGASPATPSASVEPSAGTQEALESCIIFLLMSKFDNHQSDMMHRLKAQLAGKFQAIALDGAYAAALDAFTAGEIIISPFHGQGILEQHSALRKASHLVAELPAFFLQQLRDRVVQHNLRVVAKYYRRVTMSRLGQLLQLDAQLLESYLSDMSSAGDLFLKIDRPAGVVSFQELRQPEEVLSDWSSDISKMLQLMEGTCHLINRENMVYKVDSRM